MSLRKVSYILLIFCIIISACKTKQSIKSDIQIDSITDRISNIITDDNLSFEIEYPFNRMYNVDNCKDTFPDNTKGGQKNKKAYNIIGNFNNIPIVPGTIIRFNHNKNCSQYINQTTSKKVSSKKNEKKESRKQNDSQFVIFIIVLIFFICLSVRNAKKVSEKFGC